jgi:hypothetical protein
MMLIRVTKNIILPLNRLHAALHPSRIDFTLTNEHALPRTPRCYG